MPYHSFEKFEVWQRAYRLAVDLYEVLKGYRDSGLKDQMTRAAVSIASNVAEGAERDSNAEFVRFLHIAKGSAAELRAQVYIASRINLITEDLERQFLDELLNISRMLHGLIKSVKDET